MEKVEVKEKQTREQETGYDMLAAEIIKLAIEDYRAAKRRNDPSGVLALQRFFRSEWCQLLCNVDGEVLIEACEKECENLKKKREKRNGQCKTSKPLPRQD